MTSRLFRSASKAAKSVSGARCRVSALGLNSCRVGGYDVASRDSLTMTTFAGTPLPQDYE